MKKLITGIALWALAIAATPLCGQEQEAQLFVNKCPDKLFIGAILDAASLNQESYEMEQVTLNPVTVAYTSLPVRSHRLSPSYDNMMQDVRAALQANGETANGGRVTASVQTIDAYSSIPTGWGQSLALPKLLGIAADGKCEKSTVLVDLSRTYFSLSMDQPSPGELSPQLAGKEEGLIYVSEIEFGRKYTVIVESSLDAAELKAAIDEAIGQKEPSEKSKDILANSTVRILTPNGLHAVSSAADNPFASLVEALQQEATPEDFGVPVAFRAAGLKDNAVHVNKF